MVTPFPTPSSLFKLQERIICVLKGTSYKEPPYSRRGINTWKECRMKKRCIKKQQANDLILRPVISPCSWYALPNYTVFIWYRWEGDPNFFLRVSVENNAHVLHCTIFRLKKIFTYRIAIRWILEVRTGGSLTKCMTMPVPPSKDRMNSPQSSIFSCWPGSAQITIGKQKSPEIHDMTCSRNMECIFFFCAKVKRFYLALFWVVMLDWLNQNEMSDHHAKLYQYFCVFLEQILQRSADWIVCTILHTSTAVAEWVMHGT